MKQSPPKTWEADLRRWRGSLPLSEVARLRGTSAGWNCNDVSFSVERVSFDDAGAAMKPFFDQVPTRLRLSPQTVDKVVEGGELALRNNAAFRDFLRRIPNAGRAAAL